MKEINNLLNRKTVKNFVNKDIPKDIIDTALHVAYKSPTALNTRPVTIYDVTKLRNSQWMSSQQSVKTANRIFLLCYSTKEAEDNARKFLAKRFNADINSEKINSVVDRFLTPDPVNIAKNQLYITAWYFTSYLELHWISWCYAIWFDKWDAKKELNLAEDVFPELIFACWYADSENPWSYETDFVRSFEDFYLWD